MSQAGIVSDTSGGGNDIRTITGDSGGPVAGDASFNVDLLGGAGVNVVGNPGTNTLTISLTGGSAAIDSLQVDAFTAPGTNPVLPDAFGLVTVRGGTKSAGTTPVQTNSLAVNTYTLQVQTSQALAATDATKIGLANFNSAHFTCDANGFVGLAGGGQAIDSFIPNSGTNPVVPAADGSITLQGTGSITTVGGLNSLTPQLTGLTNHNILAGAGTATITNIAPSATSGIPLVSNGSSADPSFTTAQVAGGGTGITTLASGFVPSGAGTSPMVPLAYGITSAATSLVERDANQNAFANNFVSKVTNVTAASGTTTLTAASARWQNLTGSQPQTFQLPDATTLSIGSIYYFNNNTTNSTLTINDGSGALLGTIPFGGQCYAVLVVNVTTAGTWDIHFSIPSNSSFGTSGLTLPSTSFVSSGQSLLKGTSSGTISILPQAAAGTYNFNLPTTAGTSGQLLTSAAGGASPMTWTSISATGAVTQVNGNSGSVTPSSGVITVTSGASNASGTARFTGSGSTLTFTASDGNSNTSFGANALVNPSSTFNTAFGSAALTAISSGGSNCGIGALALTAVSTGNNNTGVGIGSLQSISTNSHATAVGFQALNANTAAQNTAVGSQAAATNSSGTGLTAIGYQALNASTGALNTAVGLQAGLLISSGQGNTICGASSGAAHTTGDFNCIFGYANGAALTTSASRNIFIGTGNTSIGASDSNIYIGINISATESNTLRIGSGTGSVGSQLNKAVICGIRGITTGVNDAVAVLVDSANQLGVTSSSRRYKNNILDITNSDKLHQLRPVQFNYPQFEASRPEYGLIAEEVESVFPEMVVYDEEGLPQTIQYHKLYGLMLAEIQSLHKRIALLEGKIV